MLYILYYICQELSNTFAEVVIHFGVDGAATCALVLDYARCMLSPLPNVYVMGPSCCLMHSLNRITAAHVLKSNFNMGVTFSLTKIMHIGTYFAVFSNNVVKEAARTPVWFPDGGAPPLEDQIHK